MERLTKRNPETGNGYIPCHWKESAEAIDKGENRLADIEDILGDDYDLDRLKEIVEADREGRCVVLPCKVGDHVVVLHNAKGAVPFVTSAVVAGMHIRDERARCGQFRKEYMVVRSNGFSKYISIDKMGKNVFLIKEEAEAVLRRMQDEGVH